jgi:hypothetical protein
MARETKEEKQLRIAAEEHLALIQKQNFRAAMPAKLMQLQADASAAGVNTRVSLTASGPTVEFTRYEYDNKGSNFEEELSYDSEEWQVEWVDRRLREFKEEIDARAARKALAEEVWKGLRAEQKAAVVEFVTYLR